MNKTRIALSLLFLSPVFALFSNNNLSALSKMNRYEILNELQNKPAIFLACFNGDRATVERLIESGTDPAIHHPKGNVNTLVEAASSGLFRFILDVSTSRACGNWSKKCSDYNTIITLLEKRTCKGLQ